jgi:hypothetical protein
MMLSIRARVATGLICVVLVGGAGGRAGAATEAELQSAVFRAKPAVVMIGVEVGATAAVRCGAGEARTVRPAPLGWIGSGSIIHPDGWVATNGHVVQPFYEKNEASFAPRLLEAAVAQACGEALGGLAGEARTQRVRALAADPANRDGLRIEKKLTVNLSNGKMYPAEVKVYSPPVYVEVGVTRDAGGATRKEYGKDVAVLKFQGHDLPVVRLARHSTDLHLGQGLFVIGFPGVVASHDLLSAATRFEPSVTVGHVSGFKEDVGGHRVIQTDAAIIQGNSGGPVFDHRGNVIGAATFTSLQGDQVVQGFNFLIPVETILEAARKAGVTPQGDSAFTRLWNYGVDLYLQDKHYRAYKNMSAANGIHPGFPDVERVREDCDIKHREQGYLHREEVQWGVMGFGGIAAVAGVWFGGRRATEAGRRRLRQLIREELQEMGERRG